MIPPDKLSQLHEGHRRRKLALCFGALERDIAGVAENGFSYHFPSLSRSEYIKKLLEILLTDPLLPKNAKDDIMALLHENLLDEKRACNHAKNHVLTLIGSPPAEWDLVISPHTSSAKKTERHFFKGIQVYAEDIRSPFNIGSIFRTADAIGVEKIFLSPFCCDPLHQRAKRSAMGCTNTIAWERTGLEDLPSTMPIFVLETGGTAIHDFVFPKEGIVIIGSEELGVSPQALRRASYGCVSIPMNGLKNSLNVGVAFGIVLHQWISYVQLAQ